MFIERILLACVFVAGLQFAAIAQTKPDCNKVGSYYNKKVCSGIENNQASYIKDLMQRKSASNSLNQVLAWTKEYYGCFYCDEEPGFRGGSVLRKVVFEDALNIGFFYVYDARVDMNIIERDGRTLIDWLQDDTEKAFDAAFETENEQDKKYLLKQIQTGQKYFNIFRNNGAKFQSELRQGGSKF
ncbi:MAG: hypothetical protein K9J17_03490 [Flavobacteriales bacterium]|nr:hypothetical protein [Flavobacteriales bacterium]